MHPLFGPQTAFGFGLRPEGCPLSHARGFNYFIIVKLLLACSMLVLGLIVRISSVYRPYIVRKKYVDDTTA